MQPAERLEQVVAAARDQLAAGADLDEVISYLRRAGLGEPDSVTAVRVLTGSDLGTARLVVHHSPVWADQLRGRG
ncbi:hypothetical protein Lfu02_45000 [Longispora fulva]|uniref:Uncharacterized protein n=1 Tax=Longispora fulva TaxID=619741 RepID=A0A8J7GFG8_9ACTN|nr:hypothetical protein [Longispora fulva]MBG6137874.1 hypothetical protein [Longispora fulva]GIG60128.1 hypothetical protein Lfu02_45000 [Longispora fulva]